MASQAARSASRAVALGSRTASAPCAAGRATGEGRAVIVTATVGWRRGSWAEALSETGCSGAVSSPPHAPRRTEPSRTPVSATAAPAVVVAVARLNSFSSAESVGARAGAPSNIGRDADGPEELPAPIG